MGQSPSLLAWHSTGNFARAPRLLDEKTLAAVEGESLWSIAQKQTRSDVVVVSDKQNF